MHLLNIKVPIIQAPMAGAARSKLAIAVSRAGGLGSIACPMLTPEEIRNEVGLFRAACGYSPLNLNFFCHDDIPVNAEVQEKWKKKLTPYYQEFSIDPDKKFPSVQRKPFNEEALELMMDLKPEVISFHFGLPNEKLLSKVKALGSKILSSATTVQEAIWLEDHGCDAIIAQGLEAGGHRGMFLSKDISTQVGLFSLLPRIVESVKVPVIAAGGIYNGSTMVAAMKLGASAVQIGTAYLLTDDVTISETHKKMLLSERADHTALTNIFTGRPARGIMNRMMKELGPISPDAPAFPHAGEALLPFKGNPEFMSLWAGQSARSSREISSAEILTKKIAQEYNEIYR